MGSVDPPEVHAEPVMPPAPLTDSQLFRMLEFLRYTEAGQAMTANQATVHQRFVTTATRTTMPGVGARVTPHVILLAGASATVYADAIILANAIECGDTTCPTAAFIVNGEFAPASVSEGGGGTMYSQGTYAGQIRTGIITYTKAVCSSTSCTYYLRHNFYSSTQPSVGGSSTFSSTEPVSTCCPPDSPGFIGSWQSNPGAAWNGGTTQFSQSVGTNCTASTPCYTVPGY